MASTVMRGDSEENGSWNTTWTARRMALLRAASLLQAWPAACSCPEKGSKPRLASARVDLPEPDSPITPSVLPGRDLETRAFTATNSARRNQPRMPGMGTG
jgi:hypothetical protein